MTKQRRAVRARISGKVQGVGYRVWTRGEAMRLHPEPRIRWIDDTLPHTFRYLGLPMHEEIETWAKKHTLGIWYTECNHIQDGVIRFANLPDAEKFQENFGHRIW